MDVWLADRTTDVSEMRKTHGMRLTASDLVAIGLTQARYAMAMGNPAPERGACRGERRGDIEVLRDYRRVRGFALVVAAAVHAVQDVVDVLTHRDDAAAV